MPLAASASEQIRELSLGELPPRTADWFRRAVRVSTIKQSQCRLNSEQNCTAFRQHPNRAHLGLWLISGFGISRTVPGSPLHEMECSQLSGIRRTCSHACEAGCIGRR